MADVGVMIEGQESLTWDRWRHLGRLVESLGFDSLWRSDHMHSLTGEADRDALETWTALALTAAETERIRFGPLVCPVTFRHPSLLARQAAAVDVLSRGRLVCGIGAGWNEGEHRAFGIPFPGYRTRREMLDEQAHVLALLWSGAPVSYEGAHYRLDGARSLPVPAQRPMPLLIGGGGRRLAPIVARHAQEWNSTSMPLDEHRARIEGVREACADTGRDPATLRLSWMAGFCIGRDDAEIRDRARRIQHVLRGLATMEIDAMLERLATRGWLVGTPEQVAEQMRARIAIGISRFMLQHHDHADDDALALFAREVVPAVA